MSDHLTEAERRRLEFCGPDSLGIARSFADSLSQERAENARLQAERDALVERVRELESALDNTTWYDGNG